MAKKNSTPPTEQESTPDIADFETTLEDVETIVRKLENGSLTLDDSLKQYEVAVGKMRHCYQLLEVAERKISVLAGVDAEGRPIVQPLGDASGGDSLVKKQASRGKRRGVGGSDSADDAEGADE